MPDPLSITGARVGRLGGITALSKQISQFIRIAREARKIVDGFHRALSSLSLCIQTLYDDELKMPEALQGHLRAQKLRSYHTGHVEPYCETSLGQQEWKIPSMVLFRS